MSKRPEPDEPAPPKQGFFNRLLRHLFRGLVALPQVVKGFMALGLIALGVVAWLQFGRMRDCLSDLVGCFGRGVEQGGACTLDTDCKGWSAVGTMACCGGQCVTKASSAQTCAAFLHGTGTSCDKPDGTIWPLSGCDVSAGICCHGRCATSCP